LEIGLKKCAWVADIMPVETNIVVILLQEPNKRDELIQALAQHGIKVIAFGPGMIRMVTHLHITKEDIDFVCNAITQIHLS
jgi:threonine aldolase